MKIDADYGSTHWRWMHRVGRLRLTLNVYRHSGVLPDRWVIQPHIIFDRKGHWTPFPVRRPSEVTEPSSADMQDAWDYFTGGVDPYADCPIYQQHGACSCSTGIPGNVCPLTGGESERT